MRQGERIEPTDGGTYLKPIALLMLAVLGLLVIGILAALFFSHDPATAGPTADVSATGDQPNASAAGAVAPSAGATLLAWIGPLLSPVATNAPASLPAATVPSPAPEATKAAPTAAPATAEPSGVAAVTPAPVAGDDRADPIVVGGIPYTVATDTRHATSRRSDPDCGGRAASVWFAHTPARSMTLAASTFGSNYDTVLHVGTRTAQGVQLIDCVDDSGDGGQSAIVFDAEAGVTYLFMVGAYGSHGRGGDLVFNLNVAPPPLTVSMTIDTEGTFDGSGAASISGWSSCSTRIAGASVEGELSQRVGRLLFHGWGYTSVEPCGPRGRSWTMILTSDNGTFGEEPATMRASIRACDEFGCASAEAVSSVTLYPGDRSAPTITPSPAPATLSPSPSPAP